MPFVGDQAKDLKAACHAGCRRVLLRNRLGRMTLEEGLPRYSEPVEMYDDLGAAVEAELAIANR
jgi:D-glycero-D-manno-heptose 1,7-bisphosphate phosphatase